MARILIADDSELIRRSLSAILSSDGHEIVGFAANGMQVLSEYEQLKPDSVTMDILCLCWMALSGAINYCEIFQCKNYYDQRFKHKERVFQSLRMGAKNYIIKPFQPEKVIEVVNLVLKQKQ